MVLSNRIKYVVKTTCDYRNIKDHILRSDDVPYLSFRRWLLVAIRVLTVDPRNRERAGRYTGSKKS